MMDLTIPGGGTSPSMVEVVCSEGTVIVSKSDFGFRNRMLDEKKNVNLEDKEGRKDELVVKVVVKFEVQTLNILQG